MFPAPGARAGELLIKRVDIYSSSVVERVSKHALFWRRLQAFRLNSSSLFHILLTTDYFPTG